MVFLHRLAKTFVGILTGLLGLSLLCTGFLLLLLWQPQWFIHEKSIRWASKHVLPSFGIELRFERIEPTFIKEDFFHRQFQFTARDLWVNTETMRLHLPSLALSLSADLHPQRFALTSLGPLEILGGDLEVKQGPPEPQGEPFVLDRIWYKRLHELHLEPLRVQFNRFVFIPYQTNPVESRFDVRLTRPLDLGLWNLELLVLDTRTKLPNIFLDLPRASAALSFAIDPEQGIQLNRLGPIDIAGKELALTILEEQPSLAPVPAPAKTSPAASSPASPQDWIAQLKTLRLEPSTIAWNKVSLSRPHETTISASLELKMSQGASRNMEVALRLNRITGAPVKQARLDGSLKLPEGVAFLPLTATVNGSADLDRLGQAHVNGFLDLASLSEGRYEIKAAYNYGPSRLQATSKGQILDGQFTIALDAKVAHPHERLQSLSLENCGIKGKIDENAAPFLQSALDCRISLTRTLSDQESNYHDLLPQTFSFDAKGPFTIPVWNDNPQFTLPIAVALLPIDGETFQLRSRSDINLSGRLKGGAESMTGTVDLDTQLLVPKFQNLVRRFAQTPWSIPAPLSPLDGLLSCSIKGRIRIKAGLVHMPVHCQSELDSSTQTLWVNAEGLIETRANQKPLIQAAIVLEKVTLQLPKISLDEPIPQLVRDKRIVEIKNAQLLTEKTPLPVELNLTIKTPEGRPLKLATHLAPVPIPIKIDVAITGDKPDTAGSISIDQYDVAFFKKKAFVEHLGVRLVKDQETPQLEGLVTFKDPDFKIDLKLSGTADSPFYTLESRPPRTQSEILSIILFGGGADELDLDNQRSVEDTRAAMVDGAIGLMSMYYLASTPIETVGYNPHTGLFRARVRLGQTLALTVGSDLGGSTQSIGLRKRLTENWSFETTAETDEETKSNHGLAMFRWGRRY